VVDDAMAIAPHTDGVVVIAAWGGTSEEALEEASRRLAAGDIRPIGVVLNGVDPNAEGAVAFCRTRAHRRQVKRYFSRDF
jgi:Mrp family chromosome partitioning ATPase